MAGPSSLAKKTASGAMWTIATGLGSRALGLIGSLVITRFIAPDVFGEVQAAAVVAYTAYFATSLGLGQYIVSQPDADRQTIFNATIYTVGLCSCVVTIAYLARAPLAAVMQAPGMVHYLPWLGMAVVIERICYIPDRLMVRDMRFKGVGLRNTAGELTYTVASVGLAMAGWGGNAIVAGTMLRAIVRLMITVPSVSVREWLTPSPLSWKKARKLLSFGLPLSMGSLANFGSTKWDNAVMSSVFGPGVMGLYAVAWNVADIPASQVGERIGDVLVPSFAKLEPERRRPALIRAITLLSLIVFPLAVGLGAVARTLFRDTFFKPDWYDAAGLLTVLSALGVTRPIGWVIASYLQVYGRTRAIMALEWLKVLTIITSVFILGHLGGPLAACSGVGLAFGLHALASMWLVRRLDGISFGSLLLPLLRPLLACAPMAGAVLAVRYGMQDLHTPVRGLRLLAEVVAGGIAFVLSALVIAPKPSRDFLDLLMGVIRRRR